MDKLNFEFIPFALTCLVPGVIALKVYDLIVPSDRRDLTKSLLEVVSFGSINLVAIYYPLKWLHEHRIETSRPLCYLFAYLFLVLALPIVWPVAIRAAITSKRLAPYVIHPIPKPWDFFFGKRQSC